MYTFQVPKTTYGGGNNIFFILNLQQSLRLLKLCGVGKLKRFWELFQLFSILGVLSYSLIFLLSLRDSYFHRVFALFTAVKIV